MLTDEKLGEAIGKRLRAEVADFHAPADLLPRLRRRSHRRALAGPACLAALSASALAVAVSLAAVGGSPAAAHGPVSSSPEARSTGAAAAGSAVQLAGYIIQAPAGYRVQKFGAGLVVTAPDGGRFTVFEVTGYGPPSSAMVKRYHLLAVLPVRAGSRQAWWEGTGGNGEFWVRLPGGARPTYLVDKVGGTAMSELVSFIRQLKITSLRVLPYNCHQPGCR